MLQKNIYLEFLKMEASRPLQYSSELDQAYKNAIQFLKDKLGTQIELRNLSVDLEEDSLQSAILQFYRLFPAHYYKFYKSLLEAETFCLENDQHSNVIGWPRLTIIDIGCGGGAASLACLTMINKLQVYLLGRGELIQPIELQFFAFEPSEHMLFVYKHMMQQFNAQKINSLVSVSFELLEGAFPTDFVRLMAKETPSQNHAVFLCMSNVIRPLSNMFIRGETYFSEMINQALNNEVIQQPTLGYAEARALADLTKIWSLDQMSMLAVAVGNDSSTNQTWSSIMNQYLKTAIQLLQNDFTSLLRIHETSATYYNLPSSYYSYNRLNSGRNFTWHFWRAANTSSLSDEQYSSLVELPNLRLAWIRSRKYSQMESLVDEIELYLFEYFERWKLDHLRCHLLQKNLKVLNMDLAFWYHTPKSVTEDRPRAIPRLEEQIVNTALIQVLAADGFIQSENSFSYHLNKVKSEYLYIYWLKLWKRYLRENRKLAELGGTVLVTDISGFFTHIDQLKLTNRIQNLIDSPPTNQLIAKLLIRDLGGNHEKGSGLMQGHIASGYWANFYLSSVDSVIRHEFPDVKYARYTDDMVFIVSSKDYDTEFIINRLKVLLHSLGLKLSKGKTGSMSGRDYLEITADNVIDELQNYRLKPVIENIYCINSEYDEAYQTDRYVFLVNYQAALAQLGLQFTVGGLARRIKSNSSLKNPPESMLLFPNFLPQAELIHEWAIAFKQLNKKWMNLLDALQNELVSLFLTSLDELHSEDKGIASRAKRRISFSANRLCSLGMPSSVANELVPLIVERPWIFRALNFICKGLAKYEYIHELFEIYNNSTSPFVRATILRAFGELPKVSETPAPQVLTAIAADINASEIERLKSTESIIVANLRTQFSYTRFEVLIEALSDLPYLQKNYIILYLREHPVKAEAFLWPLISETKSSIVVDAFQYMLHHTDSSEPLFHEYRESTQFYAESYPAFEDDEREVPSPTQILD